MRNEHRKDSTGGLLHFEYQDRVVLVLGKAYTVTTRMFQGSVLHVTACNAFKRELPRLSSHLIEPLRLNKALTTQLATHF
jgi:hypothetical protein